MVVAWHMIGMKYMQLLNGYDNRTCSYVWYNYQCILYGYSHTKREVVFDGHISKADFEWAISRGILTPRSKSETI